MRLDEIYDMNSPLYKAVLYRKLAVVNIDEICFFKKVAISTSSEFPENWEIIDGAEHVLHP